MTPYVTQPTLASLYDSTPPHPPTPTTKNIWSDPGATNAGVVGTPAGAKTGSAILLGYAALCHIAERFLKA